MSGRVEFDGVRQRAVCAKLQHRAGLDGTEAATRIGYSYPQALRYFRGQTPIRPDQYAQFAAAYGVRVEDFAAELAGVDVYPDLRNVPPAEQPDRWTFRDALHGHIPDWLIEKLAPEWEGKPLVNQQSAVEAILEMAAEQRAEVTHQRPNTHAV